MTLVPERTAFLFPGQGSQTVGMGRELAAAEPAAAAVFTQADQILGVGLSRLCWDGPAETLNDTLNTQPALFAHSAAVLRALENRLPGFHPAFVAGHSLGEFTALLAAGALEFADGVRLVRERGVAMKAAGQIEPGGMAAVLGLDAPAVEDTCREVAAQGGTVQVANDNCPGQVVISGDAEALNQAIALLGQRGARKVIRLAVSIAAHSPLMVAAQAHFQEALDRTPIREPSIPVLGNVQASAIRTAQELRHDLSAQLTSPVRWTDSIRAMSASGVDTFIELGPGSVLSGLVRRILPQARAIALDAPESFRAIEA